MKAREFSREFLVTAPDFLSAPGNLFVQPLPGVFLKFIPQEILKLLPLLLPEIFHSLQFLEHLSSAPAIFLIHFSKNFWNWHRKFSPTTRNFHFLLLPENLLSPTSGIFFKLLSLEFLKLLPEGSCRFYSRSLNFFFFPIPRTFSRGFVFNQLLLLKLKKKQES